MIPDISSFKYAKWYWRNRTSGQTLVNINKPTQYLFISSIAVLHQNSQIISLNLSYKDEFEKVYEKTLVNWNRTSYDDYGTTEVAFFISPPITYAYGTYSIKLFNCSCTRGSACIAYAPLIA